MVRAVIALENELPEIQHGPSLRVQLVRYFAKLDNPKVTMSRCQQ